MNKLGKSVVLFLTLLFVAPFVHAADAAKDAGFPLRWRYPDIRTLDTEQTRKMLSAPGTIVVDSRTRFEWQTLRVTGSYNVPVDEVDTGTNKRFEDGITQLHKEHPETIVFYCNGRSCPKSYEAARRAIRVGIKDVYAYDAGIFDWAKAHPELTSLYDKSSITPADLLTAKQFAAHLLAAKEFKARANNKKGVVVLDIRDAGQRDFALFPFQEQRATLDDTAGLDSAIGQAKRGHRTLLVYDAVGKQVQWLQYYLVKHGVQDYYFMKNGEEGYVAELP